MEMKVILLSLQWLSFTFAWDCLPQNDVCITKVKHLKTWQEALNYCRRKGAFMVGEEVYQLGENEKILRASLDLNENIWIALKFENESLQWMGRNPGPAVLPFADTLLSYNANQPCYTVDNKYNVNSFSCQEKFPTYCLKSAQNAPNTDDAVGEFHLYRLQLKASERLDSQIVKTNSIEISNLSLECQLLLDDKPITGTSFNWIKDGSYITWNVSTLELGIVNLPNKEIEGISTNQSKEGVYSCEFYIPFSAEKLSSNSLTVLLEDILSIYVPISNDRQHELWDHCSSWSDQIPKNLGVVCPSQNQTPPNSSTLQVILYSKNNEPIYNEHVEKGTILSSSILDILVSLASYITPGYKDIKFSSFCTSKLFPDDSFEKNVTFTSFPIGENSMSDVPYCKYSDGTLLKKTCKYTKYGAVWFPQDVHCQSYRDNKFEEIICLPGYKRFKNHCIKHLYGTWRQTLDLCALPDDGCLNITDYIYLSIEFLKNLKPLENSVRLQKFYLPLTRIQPFGPFLYTYSYKCNQPLVQLGKRFLEGHPIANYSCLGYDWPSQALFSVPCDEQMHSFCLRNTVSLTKLSQFENLYCPDGWWGHQHLIDSRECWNLQSAESVTWAEAERQCTKNSSKLVNIKTLFHQRLLNEFKKHLKVNQVWIGLRRNYTNFKWTDDDAISFTNWNFTTNFDNQYAFADVDGTWLLGNEEMKISNIICFKNISSKETKKTKLILGRKNNMPEICVLNTILVLNMSIFCSIHGRELAEVQLPGYNDKNNPMIIRKRVCQTFVIDQPSSIKCFGWIKSIPSYIESEAISFTPASTYVYICQMVTNSIYIPSEHDQNFKAPSRYKHYQNIIGSYIMKASLPRDITLFLLKDNMFFTPEGLQLSVIFYVAVTYSDKEYDEWTIYKDDDVYKSLMMKIFYPGTMLDNAENATVNFIRSIAICPSESSISGIQWFPTLLNTNAISTDICVGSNEAVSRECFGDYFVGGIWQPDTINCPLSTNSTKRYKELKEAYNMNVNDSTVDVILNKFINFLENLEGNIDYLSLTYIIKKLENIEKAKVIKTESTVSTSLTLINNLLKNNISDDGCDEGNFSSIILNIAEKFDEHLQINITDSTSHSRSEISISNALVTSNSFRGFSKSERQVAHLFEETQNFTGLEDITNAIIFSETLMDDVLSTQKDGEPFRLSFKVINNTKNFGNNITLEGHPNKTFILNSAIVVINIRSNIIFEELDEPVRVFFSPTRKHKIESLCVYWDYTMNGGKGGWSQNGCEYRGTDNHLDVCSCSHLTSFAEIISLEQFSIPIEHRVVLDMITVVGCSLSLVGLLLTIATYVFFRKWREFIGNKVIAQLALSLSLTLIIFLGGFNQTENTLICKIVALLLQYFILSSFCWMLVKAAILYIKIVKVLGPHIPRLMLKASLFAWGIPMIPVGISWGFYWNNGIRTDVCWLAVQPALFSLYIPVGIIVMANLVVFFILIYNVIYKKTSIRTTQLKSYNYRTQLKMAIGLFTLLGLGWLFGFLAFGSVKLIFTYIFCIFSSFQGFFIFVFYVLRNEKSMRLWNTALQDCPCYFSKYQQSRTNSSMGVLNNPLVYRPPNSTSELKPHHREKPMSFNSTESRVHEIDHYLKKKSTNSQLLNDIPKMKMKSFVPRKS